MSYAAFGAGFEDILSTFTEGGGLQDAFESITGGGGSDIISMLGGAATSLPGFISSVIPSVPTGSSGAASSAALQQAQDAIAQAVAQQQAAAAQQQQLLAQQQAAAAAAARQASLAAQQSFLPTATKGAVALRRTGPVAVPFSTTGEAQESGVPTWVWIAGGAVLLGGGLYLLKRKRRA